VTIYEPNPDVQPTGGEIAEFVTEPDVAPFDPSDSDEDGPEPTEPDGPAIGAE
jgi:hypothetical protein